jgi:hypothetical protein
METDRLITGPDFAPTRPFQLRKFDFNDRAWKRDGYWRSERHDAEREGA